MMFFANFIKQTIAIAIATVTLMVIASLPTASAVTIGVCQQTKGDHNCGQTNATADGKEHGDNVLPYNNCYAFKTNYPTKFICADTLCTDCGHADKAAGDCMWFSDNTAIRCVTLA